MQDLKLTCNPNRDSEFELKGVKFGTGEIVLMAGPCAVESEAQVYRAAQEVKRAGGKVLRGGIFKPRSSPYSFQGLGKEGLNYLVTAAKDHGLLSITEVLDAQGLEVVADSVDIIQIGARNMQNFELLRLAGKANKPVVLKRGLAATIEEWLLAAEYILAAGNPHVILCERGIRTFETATRSTLDLSSVAVVKGLTSLPVIVDPSHAAGKRDLVPALAKAAIGVGADGLIIEMHPEPESARCDGSQSLYPEQLHSLSREMAGIARSVNRYFCGPQQEGLSPLRSEIDWLDEQIISLLSERMKMVEQVGRYKSADRVRDPFREKEVLKRLKDKAVRLGCPAALVNAVYTQIFNIGVEKQLENKNSPKPFTGIQ